jgi:dihydrofolate reductase
MPKYVVSSSLDEPKWVNATVLTGDVPAQVAKLKQGLSGDILVYASYHLARTVIENDLVDELRLVVFPVILGDGQRLFGTTSDQKQLRLLSTQPLGEGLSFLTYEFLR